MGGCLISGLVCQGIPETLRRPYYGGVRVSKVNILKLALLSRPDHPYRKESHDGPSATYVVALWLSIFERKATTA
eukprot:1704002-Amphidinium_carterae.1